MSKKYQHNTFNFHLTDKWNELNNLNTPTRNITNFLKRKKTLVYISLTSSPLRLKNVPLMLSFLDLTNIHQIHINLPKYYRNKKKGGVYNTSDIKYIESLDSRIKVFRPNRDLGPITKILPTLQRIKQKNSIIISLDDDIAYERSLINELIYFSFKSKKTIYAGDGFNFGDFEGSDFNRKLWPTQKQSQVYTDVVEGWSGIAYPKWIVNKNIIDRMLKNSQSISTDCKLSDDIIINETFAYYGINRKTLSSFDNWYHNLSDHLKYGELGDALHKGSGVGGETSENVMDENMAKYDRCINSGSLGRRKQQRRSYKKK